VKMSEKIRAYLIKDQNTGYTKIADSSRLGMHESQVSSFDASFDDLCAVKAVMQRKHRISEWFDLDDKDCSKIKSYFDKKYA
jgi:hypothetical protein